MALKIAICDETKKDIANLRAALEKSPALTAMEHMVSDFLDGRELLNAFEAESRCFDIVFLNPQLSRKSGADLAAGIRAQSPRCGLILVCGSAEYALAGYRAAAVGYLLKPLAQQELDLYLRRAIQAQSRACGRSVFLKCGQEYVSLSPENLVFAESSLKYIYLHLSDGTVKKVLMPIDRLLEALGDECFIKTHKSFIANMNFISAAAPYEFTLGSFGSVSVTQRRYPQIKRHYIEFSCRAQKACQGA